MDWEEKPLSGWTWQSPVALISNRARHEMAYPALIVQRKVIKDQFGDECHENL